MAMHDCTGQCVRAWEVMEMQIQLSADSLADVTFTSYNKVALHSDPQYSEGQRALEARAKTAEGDRRSVYTQFQHFFSPLAMQHHSSF